MSTIHQETFWADFLLYFGLLLVHRYIDFRATLFKEIQIEETPILFATFISNFTKLCCFKARLELGRKEHPAKTMTTIHQETIIGILQSAPRLRSRVTIYNPSGLHLVVIYVSYYFIKWGQIPSEININVESVCNLSVKPSCVFWTKLLLSQHQKIDDFYNNYCMQAIITCGFYSFYPIFHFGLY